MSPKCICYSKVNLGFQKENMSLTVVLCTSQNRQATPMHKFRTILLPDFCRNFGVSFRDPGATVGKLGSVSGFFVFGAGVLAAKALSMIAQVYLGRNLGPHMYGQLTLILLLSSYFCMPMTNGWGLAYVRLASMESAWEKKLEYLKAVLVVSAGFSAATLVLLTLLSSTLCHWLNIDETLFRPILILTSASALWFLAKLIAQGLQHWNMYIMIELVWSILISVTAVGLIILRQLNLHHMVTGFTLSYVLAALLPMSVIIRSLNSRMNYCYMRDIFVHGGLLLINALIGVGAFSIDRLVINHSLGATQVGIYQAHFFATYGIVSALITVFVNYVFPRFCADHDLSLVFLMRGICFYAYPIILLVTLALGVTMLLGYGYPLSLPLFAALCVFTPCNFHLQIKSWYLASRGTTATRWVLQSQIIFFLGNLTILALLVERYGINAGGVALLGATILALAYLLIIERRLVYERTLPALLH